jgi:methionine-rich copper-binding protein CopC
MKSRTSASIRLVIVFVVGLMVPALLQAHAKLEKTQPADGATVSVSPPQIQLWFDEEVDVKVSKIEVTGPSGKVAVGPTRLMGPKALVAKVTAAMADAAYTVRWQTAAADDGHVSKGAFKFIVKQAH